MEGKMEVKMNMGLTTSENLLVPRLQQIPEGLNPVSEGMKKKIARNQKMTEEATKAKSERSKRLKNLRHEMKMRIFKYESQYRKQRESVVQLKRDARAKGGFYREQDPKVLFIIRLKGVNKLSPKPKKILQLFRLRQVHNGVFMRVNKATTEMLKFIEPFVTYGYLSLSTTRKLLYKRGYGRIGKLGHRQRIRLSDNSVISSSLGEQNIHCVEDLVNQLYTCGPNFKQVSTFLWPFKLTPPRGGFVAKRHGFCEPRAGDWGNREHLINDLVKRML